MGLRELAGRAVSGTAWVPAAMLAMALLALAFGESGRELLRYERMAIASGETWRLVTAHIAHLGWPHLAMNAAGLLLVWLIVGGAFSALRWATAAVIIVVVIDAGLWAFSPEVRWYVGLSGLLHGLLAAGLVVELRRPAAETVVLGLLLVAKLAWEQMSGPLPGSASGAGGDVIVDAHLYGAVGGVLAALVNRATVAATPRI